MEKGNYSAHGLTMFGRIFLILTCSILPAKRLVANDSIDSLYRKALTTNHFDYKQANRLMLMLDVEGVTDSLMTFDSNTDKQEMMASVHFYVSTYYFEVAQRMTAAIKAAQRAEAIAREACDTPMIVEALSTQSVAAIRTGQMESALRTAKEELRIDQLTGDIANLSRAYNILAALSLQGNRLDDAEKYNVYKAEESEPTYTFVAQSNVNSFLFELDESSKRTTFAVTAVSDDGSESERGLVRFSKTELRGEEI